MEVGNSVVRGGRDLLTHACRDLAVLRHSRERRLDFFKRHLAVAHGAGLPALVPHQDALRESQRCQLWVRCPKQQNEQALTDPAYRCRQHEGITLLGR